MLSILDSQDNISRGGRENIKLSFYIDKQLKNIAKANAYYSTVSLYVNANNIIYRLLMNFDYSDKATPVSAFNRATEEVRELCLLHDITTSTYKGGIDKNSFNFSDGCVYMLSQEYSFIDIVKLSWDAIKPVRMVYRETADHALSIPLPSSPDVKGIGALTIDVPALAAMYTGWRIQNNLKPDNDKESVNDFITRYVYNGLIIDQNRLAYINMFSGTIDKIDEGEVPFAYMKQMDSLKSEVHKLYEETSSQSVHHTEILKEYPGFDLPKMYDLAPTLGIDYKTENNLWFILLCESPIVESVLYMTPRDTDADVKLRFNIYSRMLKGNGVLRKAPNKNIVKVINLRYDSISKLIDLR